MQEKSRLWKSEQIKKMIIITQNRILEAEKEAIDINKASDKIRYARGKFENNNEKNALEDLFNARSELTEAIKNSDKRKRWEYYSRIYGIHSLLVPVILMPTFFFLLWYCGDKPLVTLSNISVPFWSLWIAGIGSIAQILIGVATDLKESGVVYKYNRVWYYVLPLISLCFGFAAYLIVICGLWTFGSQISNSVEPSIHHNANLFLGRLCY
jgi:hypothetical protein